MKKSRLFGTVALTMIAAASTASAAERRPMQIEDLDRIKTVGSPQVDPTGTWVAYSVQSVDSEADKGSTHIWMTRWDGSRTVQLTSRKGESENTPRWSPDGRSLAFISSRGDEKENDQLWIMEREGGEARRAADVKGSVADYAWSPNGRQIALIVEDPDPDEEANAAAGSVLPSPPKPGEPAPPTGTPEDKAETATDAKKEPEKRPKPIVIDRFQFKEDIAGYLGKQRQRLWLLDLDTGKLLRLTTGDYNEALPSWSPDGSRIVFVSNRGEDPDRTYNDDLFLVNVSSVAPSTPQALTTFEGSDNNPDSDSYPVWSPDGRSIAYLQSGPVKLLGYGVNNLAVIPASGGAPRLLTTGLDRNVSLPSWSPDGRSISFLVEDDGATWIGAVPARGGAVKRLTSERRLFTATTQEAKQKRAVLVSTPNAPAEVHALEGGRTRPLSRQNEAWLAQVRLAPVEETRFRSADGTEVHGFLLRPLGAPAATRSPTILRIHGGPTSQYNVGFNAEWQLFAAHGYAVIAANPRGSTGRGQDFSRAIYAAWGSVDVADVLAAVDDAVARGVADPNRLGIGGWSYGGMLTNYAIATDQRFKAAVSGASIANVLGGYGTDQYIRDYEMELGKPWENLDAWMRVSYPFFRANRITTPTLFLVGEKDFNVPALSSEQMYQALRSQGVDSRLVIYPGQFHGLKRPSFIRDRMQRYLDWYDARLKPSRAPAQSTAVGSSSAP